MRRVKTAVVGLGRGATLAKFILQYSKSLELVAVADLNHDRADKFALEYNIPEVYYSLDDVLKTDVEAVVLATPITDHAEHVIKSLDAGKHVLSEVICATTLEDCQRLADAVKRSGKKYMMEENYCYYLPLTIVQNMVKLGMLGDVYYGESDYLMDFQLRKGFPDEIDPWRKEVYFAHRGHPYITHSLGPICYTLGSDIKTVTCMGAGKYDGITADRTCVLMLQTEDGSMIRLRNSFICARPDLYTYYGVQGTKGCYQGSIGGTDNHKVHIRGICGPQEWRDVYEFKGLLPKEWDIIPEGFDVTKDNGTCFYDSGTPLLLEAFGNCIINDTEPPINAKRSLNWTAAGIMSEMSINNGGIPMEIPDFGL